MAKKKILWVEDDEEIILAFKSLFESQGWEVHSTSSAEQGKALAKETKPDLIIMDVMLTGQHGFDAIEDIKKEAALVDVPIIVFSGVTQKWGKTTATREDGLLTEADEFIDKLESPDVLLSTISKYLH